MDSFQQVPPESVLFVSGESPSVYFHVSALAMLDASDRPGFGFDSFRDHMESRLSQIAPFRWRLHEVPFGLDLPYWVEDDEFDFENHVRRIAVPSPGDREALGEIVAYLYSRHLDRQRPLWETWFIEGVDDDRFAVFTKVHHCMFDGQAAATLLEAICDFEPDAEPRPVTPELASARPVRVPDRWRESVNTVQHLSEFPLRAGQEVFGAVRSSLRVRRDEPAGGSRPARAPRSPFNRDITGRRGFVFGSLSLDDVKAVKEHFGVTVNDVVLAVVGGSLREYLRRRGELPERPLRSSIAVSLRQDGHDPFSNQVTTASISLATDVDDPVARLRAIGEDTDQAKRHARSGAKGLLEMVSVLPRPLVSALTSIVPSDVAFQVAHANVIVSSVRGSPFPLYFGGARATGIYPMSIITTGGGLNVTCMSYANQIDVGITTEPRLVTDPWSIIDGLDEELQGYRNLLPIRRRRATSSGGRPRSKNVPAREGMGG